MEEWMKYICLGYLEPGKFENMSESERNTVLDECFSYNDELRKNGHLVAEESLQPANPDEDIKIEFNGRCTGEKLYEELNTIFENTAPTAHEKIRIFVGNGMPDGDMLMWLNCLREICEARDLGRLVVALKETVLDYSPSAHLLRRMVEPKAMATFGA